MADCDFTIIREHDFINQDSQASFKVNPDVVHPCAARFYYNNQLLSLGTSIDDIYVTGISAGHVFLKALADNPRGQLRVEVTCNGEIPCGPVSKLINITGHASNSDTIVTGDLSLTDISRFLEFIRRWALIWFWLPVWVVVRILFGEEAGDWVRRNNWPIFNSSR